MFIAIEKRLIAIYIATITAVLLSLLAVALNDEYHHEKDAAGKSRVHAPLHTAPR